MKILDGRELAGFIKERQAAQVHQMSKKPKLLILRDSDNPVITKYVNLKKQYGEDIGVEVIDVVCTNVPSRSASLAPGATGLARSSSPCQAPDLLEEIIRANNDSTIDGIIIQLPLINKDKTDEITSLIAPKKDVDGLSKNGDYDSATATAINWLLAGYDIKLQNAKIAIVGRGKLVGAPLYKMFTDSNYNVTLFHRGSDLTKLNQYDIIITATGVPGLIVDSMVRPGAVVIDAGTASDKGVLKGDLAAEVRNRTDLAAITPEKGGVGPLTVTCLFDHVIHAAAKND